MHGRLDAQWLNDFAQYGCFHRINIINGFAQNGWFHRMNMILDSMKRLHCHNIVTVFGVEKGISHLSEWVEQNKLDICNHTEGGHNKAYALFMLHIIIVCHSKIQLNIPFSI